MLRNLRKKYQEEVVPSLLEKFQYKNPMLCPNLSAIIISMGVAEAAKDKGVLQEVFKELTLIAGQKPIKRQAKKAISNWKSREGQTVGFKVTLRRDRMWDFFLLFNTIVTPRIRDFQGFRTKCDGRGNYSCGVEEQQIFPQLLGDIKKTQGMNITFVTTAKTDAECVELLRQLGMPFKEKE